MAGDWEKLMHAAALIENGSDGSSDAAGAWLVAAGEVTLFASRSARKAASRVCVGTVAVGLGLSIIMVPGWTATY